MHDGDKLMQELTRPVTRLIRMQFGASELRRATGGGEQVKPSLLGANLGNINLFAAYFLTK